MGEGASAKNTAFVGRSMVRERQIIHRSGCSEVVSCVFLKPQFHI